MKKVAIKLSGVVKKYELVGDKPTLVEKLTSWGSKQEHFALAGVSVKIMAGEKVGIIGKNGSGKTTLLEVIAGITTPTSGNVRVNGRVVSLIDISAGFHPELTGYENLYVNGLILGIKRPELKAMEEQIVGFSGLGEFIGYPLYTYSEGMKLRLGFAVAIHANPDVLLLDETLSAGDQEFQAKLTDKLDEIYKAKKTVVVVTHWLDYLRKTCRKILWLENGSVVKYGGLNVIDEYEATK